jgi:hypothetical protein
MSPLVNDEPTAAQEKAVNPKRGIAGLLMERWRWVMGHYPDYSLAAFDRAVDEALTLVSGYRYRNQMEIASEVADYVGMTLRAAEVRCEWIGNSRSENVARYVIRTPWGARARVDIKMDFAPAPSALGKRTN